jgi:hypothetical protein
VLDLSDKTQKVVGSVQLKCCIITHTRCANYSFLSYQVINHKAYDHRADVFSFAIVLWELVTSKVNLGVVSRFYSFKFFQHQ